MRSRFKTLGQVLLCVVLLALVACAQTGSQIGTSLSLCCPGDYAGYQDYGLETQDMPLFLRDYVVAEFDAAFQEKGLQRDDRFNDIRVLLRYNHVNLDPEQERIDPFIRMESITVELNYIAVLEIEVIETATNKKIWAGSISRIHQVTPGEYMHEDRARPAFAGAFLEVLSSYPAR